MYTALHLSPMIPSFNLPETGRFFEKLLGFEWFMNEATYAILYKNNLTIHLLRAGEDIGQMEFYLEVDAIDALWKSIKDQVEGLKVRPPFNQEYGMREFHIGVPHTNTLLFVGQKLP